MIKISCWNKPTGKANGGFILSNFFQYMSFKKISLAGTKVMTWPNTSYWVQLKVTGQNVMACDKQKVKPNDPVILFGLYLYES